MILRDQSAPAVAVTVTGSPGKTDCGLAEQASVTGGGGAMEPSVNHNAGAQPRGVDVGAAAWRVTCGPKSACMYS